MPTASPSERALLSGICDLRRNHLGKTQHCELQDLAKKECRDKARVRLQVQHDQPQRGKGSSGIVLGNKRDGRQQVSLQLTAHTCQNAHNLFFHIFTSNSTVPPVSFLKQLPGRLVSHAEALVGVLVSSFSSFSLRGCGRKEERQRNRMQRCRSPATAVIAESRDDALN